MTREEREEAVEIIKIERECVERNTSNKCDRDCTNCDLLRMDEEIFSAYDMAIEALKEPERKKGRWENGEPCPICGEDRFKDMYADIWADWQPSFCPNCGADMRGK